MELETLGIPGKWFNPTLYTRAYARALDQPADKKTYGTHLVRKGVAIFECNGSTGVPQLSACVCAVGGRLEECKTATPVRSNM
ncbi:uncharacterized protein PITG_05147 [Phytophthora infestans T30-4]|uniref:Uncharacterized protein n=1 Tax=Phytophthora infestans (strain T30-4) TaxID=403677 RepID=D0N3N5_PHYIT|nr:uncharacterized protein PITG_05147 [Phytophthora infestans T30-4]EEY68989.1 hypothetical protein PITG_05147 [Phytophthora infestans T30-4]|eukprot:XP_002998843.1 hypothetical protein PITG_05147 [Phytophthora infestans T30-4]